MRDDSLGFEDCCLATHLLNLVNIMPIPRQIVQIQLIFVTFLDSLIWPYGITFYLYTFFSNLGTALN